MLTGNLDAEPLLAPAPPRHQSVGRLATCAAFTTVLALAGCSRDPAPDPAATYDKFCAVCHGADGRAATGTDSPQLANPAFLAAADADYLRAAISSGRRGTKMSTFAEDLGGPMTAAEIDAVVEHIAGWRDPAFPTPAPFVASGDPSAGRLVYESKCAECHGPNGASDAAPDLSDPVFQETASDGFLRHALEFGRPGTDMKPAELTEREIHDVIAFLRNLEPSPEP